jgi:hypothetical protein
MEVKEIKDKKEELRKNMIDLILLFHKDTGTIPSIDIVNSVYESPLGDNSVISVNVNIKVEI